MAMLRQDKQKILFIHINMVTMGQGPYILPTLQKFPSSEIKDRLGWQERAGRGQLRSTQGPTDMY